MTSSCVFILVLFIALFVVIIVWTISNEMILATTTIELYIIFTLMKILSLLHHIHFLHELPKTTHEEGNFFIFLI
jgi:hypothetical protein